jgi:hypothetical protein
LIAAIAGEVEAGFGERVGIGAHHRAKAAEFLQHGLGQRLYVAALVGGEQQHFEQFVVGQAFGTGGHHPLAQPLTMAEKVRPGGRFGELVAVAAVPRGIRKRSRPVGAAFPPLDAIDLAAQRPYPLLLGGIEHPDMSDGVPLSAEAARPGREIGVVRRADDDMAVPFHDRERHPTPRLQHACRQSWHRQRQCCVMRDAGCGGAAKAGR